MNQMLAYGTVVLAVAAVAVFVTGVFTNNQGLVLAGWIIALAFIVIAFHAGEHDYKERKKK